MVTLTQLEYIVAIDEYRHFSTAAEKCFVTQPTLSMQIKKLEEELGVVVFDRSRQPVVPTDIGAKLIEQARAVLASAGRLREIIDEEREKVRGSLRLGIIPTLAPYLLPLFIGRYTRKYPCVKVVVEELVSDEIVRRLKHDRLDAGVFVTPYHDDRIAATPLCCEELLLYAHPAHPLLHGEPPAIGNLDPAELWMLGSGHCFRNQVVNLCGLAAGREKALPFGFESNSLETLMRLVDAEGGYTLIPELACRDMAPRRRAQVREFAGTRPLREISLIYSRHYAKQRLIRLLGEEIRAAVPPHMLQADRGMVVEWQKDTE